MAVALFNILLKNIVVNSLNSLPSLINAMF
jgi:hypothetical protein